MVHIHWKAFTPPPGPAVAADKFVFNLGGGLDTDNGQTFVIATVISADFKAAIRYYSTLVSQAGIYGLYANFHSQWSPPSPFGAMAGRLQVSTGSGTLPVSPDQGSLVLLPSNPACDVVTERVSYRLRLSQYFSSFFRTLRDRRLTQALRRPAPSPPAVTR
jgi:hypothetical protein